MKLIAAALFAAVCAGWVPLVFAQDVVPAAPAPQEDRVVFPASVPQGALVFGKVPPGSQVRYRERLLRATGYGTVALGVGRDETGPLKVDVTLPSGRMEPVSIAVTPRDWPVEHVNGVPPKTVNPPPEIAARIQREQALVTAARERDDERTDFALPFQWPVQGRISGRFGNARVYNGQPGAGHSGMDIAAPDGTPVKAPAGGVVTFASPDLYLTGGTVLLAPWPWRQFQFPAPVTHRREGGRPDRTGTGHRGRGCHGACDGAASALGNELVRYAYRSAVGTRTREVTHPAVVGAT